MKIESYSQLSICLEEGSEVSSKSYPSFALSEKRGEGAAASLSFGDSFLEQLAEFSVFLEENVAHRFFWGWLLFELPKGLSGVQSM